MDYLKFSNHGRKIFLNISLSPLYDVKFLYLNPRDHNVTVMRSIEYTEQRLEKALSASRPKSLSVELIGEVTI